MNSEEKFKMNRNLQLRLGFLLILVAVLIGLCLVSELNQTIPEANSDKANALHTSATPPTRIYPLNGITIDTRSVDFKWLPDPNAFTYDIAIAHDYYFNNEIYSTTILGGGPFEFNWDFDADGTYYWKMRTFDTSFQLSSWSSVWSFNIDTVPDQVPLISPPNGYTFDYRDGITLQWWNTPLAAVYELQVSKSSSFSTLYMNPIVVVDLNLPGETVYHADITVYTDDTYYWRVRAVSIYNDPGPWSDVRYVNVDTKLDPPVRLTPQNGEVIKTRDVTFTWLPVLGAIEYQIVYYLDGNFANPIYLTTTTATAFTVEIRDGTHAWKIKSISQWSDLGPWSDAW